MSVPRFTVPDLRKEPWPFFLLTLLFTWTIWIVGLIIGKQLLVLPDSHKYFEYINMIGGAIPSILGILFIIKTKGLNELKVLLFKMIDLRHIGFRWMFLILFLMPLVYGTSLFLCTLIGEPLPTLPLIEHPIFILVFFAIYLLPYANAFREEFGWRGYALNTLQTQNSTALYDSILIGFIWGVWHLPLWYYPLVQDTYSNIPLLFFIIDTILISILLTWLFTQTNHSMFTAIVFHISLNLAIKVFRLHRTDWGNIFSLLLKFILVLLLLGYYGWRNREFIKPRKKDISL